MTVEELFHQLGGLMFDDPSAANLPVVIEMGFDGGIGVDDIANVRQDGENYVAGHSRVLILSAEKP